MSWRPSEGWKGFMHRAKCTLSSGCYDCYAADAYEAGADAMLEALKEKGTLMNPEQMMLLVPDRQFSYGWLVFIEEQP